MWPLKSRHQREKEYLDNEANLDRAYDLGQDSAEIGRVPYSAITKNQIGALMLKFASFILGATVLAAAGAFAYVNRGDLLTYLDDPAIKSCEITVVKSLKSPSTYKRVNADFLPSGSKNTPSVYIEFDAQNGFGASIRHISECSYTYEKDQKFPMLKGNYDLKHVSINGSELSKIQMLLATADLSKAKVLLIREDETKLDQFRR